MMALPADMKIGSFLEWCTELPFSDRPRQSQTFLIQNIKYYFYFCKDMDYYVYLKPITLSLRSAPLSLVIYCDYDGSGNYHRSLTQYITPDRYLYAFRSSDLPETMSYNQGYFVRFCILFLKDDCHSFPLERKTESKFVQTGSYLNAEVAAESLSGDFSKLLESGPNHDAEIICREHSIKAHKIVLCSRSTVLSAMLQSNMLEGRTGVIEIKDMDMSYVQEFLRYLYTGKMPELTFDNAKILYEAGDKYAVRSLMLRCSEYLQDNLSSENVFQCFELGNTHSDENLKGRVMSYVLEKKMYLQGEIWLPFCKSYPEMALEVYRLSYKNTTEMKEA